MTGDREYLRNKYRAELDEWWVEQQALHVSSCVLCSHALIDHHESSLRCQIRTKLHWWSRSVQCSCEMRNDHPFGGRG